MARPQRWLATFGVVVTLASAGWLAHAAFATEAGESEALERTYIGDAQCRLCHQLETEHWNDTVHAAAFRSHPRNELEARGCEACHGPGSAHQRNPGDLHAIQAFTSRAALDVETQNSVCLTCHEGGSRFHWAGSVHETRNVACSDCHNPMAKTSPSGLLREAGVTETCLTCHAEQRLQFRKRSHMPVLEGKMDCADCHNPHGSVTPALVAADSVNQLCYGCHADKRGPFLWEHAPVTENCLSCHEPHGSNRDNLLSTSIPFLCQQCHAQVSILDHQTTLLSSENLAIGTQPDERLFNRGCVNCHSQIHGSNHPAGARFHR